MARKTQIHYKAVRERYVQAINYLLNKGMAKSKTEIADQLGVHQVQLNRLMSVERDGIDSTEAPTIDMIIELSDQFGISCEWMMTGTGVMHLRESQRDRLNSLEKQFKKVIRILTAE